MGLFIKLSLRLPIIRGRGLAVTPLNGAVKRTTPMVTPSPRADGLLAKILHPGSLAGRVLRAPLFVLMGIPTDGPARVPLGDPEYTVQDLVERIQYCMDSSRGHMRDLVLGDLGRLFDLAAQEPSPVQRDVIIARGLGLALEAGEQFSNGAYLELARKATNGISPQNRPRTATYVDEAIRKIRATWIPEATHQQLREAISKVLETAAEDVVARACADIIHLGYRQLQDGRLPLQIVTWASGQIEALLHSIQDAARSVDQRRVAHDIRNALVAFISELRLANMDDQLAQIFHPDRHVTTSRQLQVLADYLSLLQHRAGHIHFRGFDVSLADQAHVRPLKTILDNLVGNAGQHRNPGQTNFAIEVSLIRGRDGARIEVRDNGAGMAPEVVANLITGVPTHNGLPVDHANPGENHGFGWLRIREACAILGIVFEIDSTLLRGTRVTLRLPRGFLASDPR